MATTASGEAEGRGTKCISLPNLLGEPKQTVAKPDSSILSEEDIASQELRPACFREQSGS